MQAKQAEDKEEEVQISSQLEAYAFNISGHYFLHGKKDRTKHLTVFALSTTTKGCEKGIANAKANGKWPPSRPSMEISQLESGADLEESTDVRQYVVVGLFIPGINKKEMSTLAKGLKGSPVGYMLSGNEAKAQTSTSILLAVTPLSEKDVDCKLYVLIDEGGRSGLRKPYNISQQEVFYFDEYRTDETTVPLRAKGWNLLVKKDAIKGVDVANLSEKQKAFRRATETSRLICEPAQSFTNDLVGLTAAFSIKKDPVILSQLRNLLSDFDPDLENTSTLRDCPNLHLLLDKDETLSKEELDGVVEEAASLWPEIYVTTDAVNDLKTGLLESKVVLEYRCVRGFLAEGCSRLMKIYDEGAQMEIEGQNFSTLSVKELGVFVSDLRQSVVHILGDVSPSRLSITDDAFASLISAIGKKLREISHAGKGYCRNLRESLGDQVVPATIDDCFEIMRNTMDVDSARLAYNMALRVAIGKLAEKDSALEKMVADLADTLERLL